MRSALSRLCLTWRRPQREQEHQRHLRDLQAQQKERDIAKEQHELCQKEIEKPKAQQRQKLKEMRDRDIAAQQKRYGACRELRCPV